MDLITFQHSIEHFYNNITCRLFKGKKFYNTDSKLINYHQYFNYYGFLEYTLTGSPHYHLIAYIDPRRCKYFERMLSFFWKKQVNSGTVDIQFLNENEFKVKMKYCTKYLNHKRSKHEIIFPPSI